MYEQYCRAVAETAAWGGQVELGALAALLQRRITVYSVGMPAVDMGPDAPGAAPSARLSPEELGRSSIFSDIPTKQCCNLVYCSQACLQHNQCTWVSQNCWARSTGGATAVLPAPRLWPGRALQQRGAEGVGSWRILITGLRVGQEGHGLANACPMPAYLAMPAHPMWACMRI